MRSVSEWICLGILLVISIRDIKERKVSVSILFACVIASVLYHCMKKEMNIWVIIGGALIGFFFVCVSKITEEGMGYGDSLAIMTLGIYLGIWNILMVLFVSFFILFCATLPLLCMKKMSRKYSLPFLPFLAGGYLFFLLMGGITR